MGAAASTVMSCCSWSRWALDHTTNNKTKTWTTWEVCESLSGPEDAQRRAGPDPRWWTRWLLTSTGGRGNKQSEKSTDSKRINSTPWAESNPQPPWSSWETEFRFYTTALVCNTANTGANIILLFSRKGPLRFLCANIWRVLTCTDADWCTLISSLWSSSPSVQSTEFPLRPRRRTLPTWCLIRLTSTETVSSGCSKRSRNFGWISADFMQFIFLFLRTRWALLRGVRGGNPEWWDTAEDANREFGPDAHRPEDWRRCQLQQQGLSALLQLQDKWPTISSSEHLDQCEGLPW